MTASTLTSVPREGRHRNYKGNQKISFQYYGEGDVTPGFIHAYVGLVAY